MCYSENENELKTIYFYDKRLGTYEKFKVECEFLEIERTFEDFESAINYVVQLSDLNGYKVQFFR